MDIEKRNYNEVLISGKINNIKHFNNYIAFGLTCNTFAKIKSHVLLVFIYMKIFITFIFIRLFFKNNKIFVKEYLNSYTDKNNKIVTYVKVTELSNNPNNIINGRKGPYIRYDEDGVMVWNGKRCETYPFSEDDPEYLEMVEMLKEYE